jgi:hypothetical protein
MRARLTSAPAGLLRAARLARAPSGGCPFMRAARAADFRREDRVRPGAARGRRLPGKRGSGSGLRRERGDLRGMAGGA